MRVYLVFLFILLNVMGCDDDPVSTTSMPAPPVETPNPDTPVGVVPRLGPGPHIGMITGFDALTTAIYNQPARVANLTAQAISAGMNISRVQIDWAELETGMGVYDASRMNDILQEISNASLPTYVTLSTLDTGEFTLPAYLMDGNGLREGLTTGSSDVLEAFENFLDWFVPQLTTAGVWGISLGNEGDTLIGDGIVATADFVSFFRRGLMRVNTLDPMLSASVTFTGGAYASYPNETTAILELSDHATVNFYCLNSALQVTDEPVWQAYIAELKTLVGSKPIFIQELGCPAAYGDDGVGALVRPASGMGGNPALQARFIDYMATVFIDDPQFIGATWFQLLDWSSELAESFTLPIAQEGASIAAARTEEWLATSGLCRWADGTCREGWDQWLQLLTATQSERLER